MSSVQKRVLRQPIVAVLGHVDHGKTTLLDKIRGTAVVKKEAGEMTQHIGASFVPTSVIEKLAEPLKKVIRFKLEIPGLLFIDTPGHELFANLRRRGGSVADLAILVIDINEGVKPQTVESIEILKARNVPFVIAANKIDKIPGWRAIPDAPFLESAAKQSAATLRKLDELIYRLIGQLSSIGVDAERFDHIRDFRAKTAIIPVSAKTGEGIPELLAVLGGIAQRYLSERLQFAEGPAKGVVLEVKETPGYGTTIDAIIYDGILRKGDTIVLAGLSGPIVTKVRAVLMPKPLTDIRIAKTEIQSVDEVYAAAGVRIAAPNLEEALAGSPLFVVESENLIEEYKKRIAEEVSSIRVKRDIEGVVVKADALGSLEALIFALEKKGIPVRLADVGPLTKREAIEASIVAKSNKYLGVILLFNVKMLPDAREFVEREGIRVFENNIIYKLIEDYESWIKQQKELELAEELSRLVMPAKIQILPGFVFRRSDPAIVGIKVLGGILRPGVPLIRVDGRRVGRVMQIQSRGQSVKEARQGDEVAISIEGSIMVGRHIKEGDILYTDVPLQHALTIINKYASMLAPDVLEVLREIAKVKSSEDPSYSSVTAMLQQKA